MTLPALNKQHFFYLLAAKVALSLAILPSESWATYEFVSTFGNSGTAFGQFASPRGVTVNHQGKIVITESGNNRVQLCDYLGVCKGFGSFGDLSGEFDRPRGVAVNSADRLFIADRGNDRIESCASTGSCTDFGGSGTSVGKFESPRGVAIDNADKIYITDTDNNRVQICDAQGSCTAFGSLGSALGKFNSPSGIAVDSTGNIVVADRGNGRIQICSAQGTNCTAFGSPGTAPGQFNQPAGIAIDSRDNIIVVDRFNDRIQVCTQQGSCTAFGSFGFSTGQFNAPWGIAVDDQDRVIVADLGNDRIQIFAESAAPAVQITSFTVTPSTLQEGELTSLSWTVSNATSCKALAGTSAWRTLIPDKTGGTTNISIATAGSYTFTLECTDGTSTVSANADVMVIAIPLLTKMNAGLTDAWSNPDTSGQGFFITVFPDIQYMFLAWFTFDTERPDESVSAILGEPGHRWIVAEGGYAGNQAALDAYFAEGGLFDTPTPELERIVVGTMIVEFTDCHAGTITYDITAVQRQGVVPIQRVWPVKAELCEALEEQLHQK